MVWPSSAGASRYGCCWCSLSSLASSPWLLSAFDRRLGTDIGIGWDPYSVRAAFSAIASSMITFIGFGFSVVVLVVQFGSTAFPPRMLRVLNRDAILGVALFIGGSPDLRGWLTLRFRSPSGPVSEGTA